MPAPVVRLLRTVAALLALLTAAGLTLGLVASASAEADFPLVLKDGHVDAFTLLSQDGQLVLALQEDVTGHHVLHEPADVLLRVEERARITLPTPVPAGLAFLGTGGEKLYFLPQTQDPDLIWPGWSTERLTTADIADPVRIRIDAVDGPGQVFLWQTGSFGTAVSVLGGGYRLPGDIAAAVNSHVHANWAFTAPGRYTLTVRATGVRPGGTQLVSVPATYTFDVGDVDPAPGASTTTAPVPSPDPTFSPTSHPTPPRTPTPAPTRTTAPAPGAVWNVRNGTVNGRGATILNAGHIDIASVLPSDAFATKVKDTTATSEPVWRHPEKTLLQLLPSAAATVPADPAYSFLGPAGSTFYQVTQIQQPGLLWPGWSTETIASTATTGGVRWALTGKSGPGEFALYETDSFGRPLVLFDTRDGIGSADRFTIPKNTHAHGSWAFSAEGLYCLSMQRVAELTSGAAVADRFVLAVAVGHADVMQVDPARCGQRAPSDPPVIPPPPRDKDGDRRGSTSPSTADPDTTACTANARTVLSAGHIDYASRIVDGRLESQIGDDTSGTKVYREPSRTILWLRPESKVVLPAGYGKVGPPGRAVWQVPQTQVPSLIWLGWSTESLNARNTHGPVTWRLDQVEGPGSVKVYLSGAFGGVQTMVLSGAGSSYRIDPGVHAHANWAFGAQGVYRLTMTQQVALANGKPSSDTEVLTVAVGDVDPTSAAGTGCAGAATSTTASASAAPVPSAAPSPLAVSSTDELAGAGIRMPATTATAPTRSLGPVPPLLGTLGGLLLLGSAGTGALWWRATAAGPVARARP